MPTTTMISFTFFVSVATATLSHHVLANYEEVDHIKMLRARRKAIVNGVDVPTGGFPSYGVYGDFRQRRENLCGGVLIHPDIYLTAAHCFFGDDRAILGEPIFLGNNRLDRSDTKESIPVAGLLRHPDFRPNFEPSHDLMLLKLNTPSTAPLFRVNRDPSRPRDNEEMVVLGFGGDERNNVFTSLQQAVVNSINFDTCNRDYDGGLNKFFQLCARGSGTDSCNNDSGGPLVAMDGTLMGVVSFGLRCGGPAGGVYTRLDTAVDFLQAGICEMSAVPPVECSGGANPVALNPLPVPIVAAAPRPAFSIAVNLLPIPRPTLPVNPPPPTAPTLSLIWPTNPAPTIPSWTLGGGLPTTPAASPTLSLDDKPVIVINWGKPPTTPILTLSGQARPTSSSWDVLWNARPPPPTPLQPAAPPVTISWTAATSPSWATTFSMSREALAGGETSGGTMQISSSLFLLLTGIGVFGFFY